MGKQCCTNYDLQTKRGPASEFWLSKRWHRMSPIKCWGNGSVYAKALKVTVFKSIYGEGSLSHRNQQLTKRPIYLLYTRYILNCYLVKFNLPSILILCVAHYVLLLWDNSNARPMIHHGHDPSLVWNSEQFVAFSSFFLYLRVWALLDGESS